MGLIDVALLGVGGIAAGIVYGFAGRDAGTVRPGQGVGGKSQDVHCHETGALRRPTR